MIKDIPYENAGDNIKINRSSWTFDGIANNFEEHIQNSIPLYKEIHNLVISLSDFFINSDSNIIDIGCSTGNLLSSISNRHKNIKNINFYFIDEVENMINKSKKNIDRNQLHKYFFICKSILEYEIPKDASIILSLFTIQFIDPSIRQTIINKIYDALSWGGGFFFFEKINGDDARFHEILIQNYEDYKLLKGYTLEEIKSKQISLRSILKPFSTKGNFDMLKRAGFIDIQPIFQYGLFKGFLAIK